MTREEFTKSMLYLSAGIQRMLKREELEVYFDMLKDLDATEFFAGVKGVLVAHVWNTFPTIAELRRAAFDVHRWRNPQPNSAEAFAIACIVAPQLDPNITGPYRVKCNGEWREFPSQADFVMKKLKVPALVMKAIGIFGLEALCNTREPIAVMRAHFSKVYEQVNERESRAALLPASVRQFLEDGRDSELVNKALADIGKPI